MCVYKKMEVSTMINTQMEKLGKAPSKIREIFEYGKRRKAEIGEENVFDFSIGNPNVPAPADVNVTYKNLIDTHDDIWLHGYTSASGDPDTRRAVAEDLNRRFGTSFKASNLYMTCGAAASLKITITAMAQPGDEFVTFTPFFPEYRVFVETSGGKLVTSPTDPETFQIDFAHLEAVITD